MSFRGLLTVFKNGISCLKGTRNVKGLFSNAKEMNNVINNGVKKEGGLLSSIFYKAGFWAGFCIPGGSVIAPGTAFLGAFTGRAVEIGGKSTYKAIKKCISIFL